MKIYNINDKSFINSDIYLKFMEDNPSLGSLEIRAFTANEAVPISGLKVEISTIYNDDKIIFFEGETDESGKIDKMFLPTPKLNDDDLKVPSKRQYEINATFKNSNKIYSVNIYENICVVQNIEMIPKLGGN